MSAVNAVRSISSMLFPGRCGCGAVGAAPCAPCWAAVREQSREIAVPVLGPTRAAVPYHGAGQRLVTSYKAGNRSLLRWASTMVADLMPAEAIAAGAVVTWIPASTAGRRARGRDQGKDLAQSVARLLGTRAVPSFDRRGTQSQTGAGRADRLRGPDLRIRADFDHRHVVLVDDVVTTGSSLRRATEELQAFQTTEVWGAVLAWADRDFEPGGRSRISPTVTAHSRRPTQPDRPRF